MTGDWWLVAGDWWLVAGGPGSYLEPDCVLGSAGGYICIWPGLWTPLPYGGEVQARWQLARTVAQVHSGLCLHSVRYSEILDDGRLS